MYLIRWDIGEVHGPTTRLELVEVKSEGKLVTQCLLANQRQIMGARKMY